jgi:hypothetical protein
VVDETYIGGKATRMAPLQSKPSPGAGLQRATGLSSFRTVALIYNLSRLEHWGRTEGGVMLYDLAWAY